MSRPTNSSARYSIVNSTFPTEVAERYDEIVRVESEEAVVAQFGRGRPYFAKPEFVPPRSKQFRPEFYDNLRRGYRSYPEHREWLGIKLPKQDLSRFDPISFPEPNEVVVTTKGSFRVVDLVLGKTRSTTAMLQVNWLSE